MAVDEEKLRKIFRSLDLDGDNSLSATELLKAFEKTGQKPTLSEGEFEIGIFHTDTSVYAMIAQVDTNGVKRSKSYCSHRLQSGTVEFHEFVEMARKVSSQ